MAFDSPRERPESRPRPLDDPYRDLEGTSPFYRAPQTVQPSEFLDQLRAELSQIPPSSAPQAGSLDITNVRSLENLARFGGDGARAGADERLSQIARAAGAGQVGQFYHRRALQRGGDDTYRLALLAEGAQWSAEITDATPVGRAQMEVEKQWCIDTQEAVAQAVPGAQALAVQLARVHQREGRDAYAIWALRRGAALAHEAGDTATFTVAAQQLAVASRRFTPEAPAMTGDAVAPVPTGWTYLVHATDTTRSWDLQAESVTIRSVGLSAITLKDRERADRQTQELLAQGIATNGYDTTQTYSQPRTPGADAVEVRIVFPRDDLSSRRRPLADAEGLAAAMSPETRRLVTKYHRDRHAVVPGGEKLVRLGEGQSERGRRVVYYVPESVAELYAKELGKSMSSPSARVKRAVQLAAQSKQVNGVT